MRRLKPLILLAAILVAATLWNRHAPVSTSGPDVAVSSPSVVASGKPGRTSELPAFLPREAHDTLARIARGGPFAHRQDGSVFGNREGLLPAQPRGYYHEYTVDTPGAGTRGARRIVTGGMPPVVYYYTADHYRSFQRFMVPQ